MALSRRRATFTADVAQDKGLGAPYGTVRCIDVDASADTSVAFAVVDDNGDTVATIASGDYTTRTRFYLTPVEARVFDTAGEVNAADSAQAVGVVAKSPLTITPTGIGSGNVVVDVYVDASWS